MSNDVNIGQIVMQWLTHINKSAKGEGAVLRRCGNLSEVKIAPATYGLEARLKDAGFENPNDDRVALCAGVMSQFRMGNEHLRSGEMRLPDAMSAGAKGGGRPVYKLHRFQRFIQHQTPETVYNPIRKVVKHLGESILAPSLATDLIYFGEKVRERWAKQYYREVLPTHS